MRFKEYNDSAFRWNCTFIPLTHSLHFCAAYAWSSWSHHGYCLEVRSIMVKYWSFCFHHWLPSPAISTCRFVHWCLHASDNILSFSVIRLETNWIVSIILCSIVNSPIFVLAILLTHTDYTWHLRKHHELWVWTCSLTMIQSFSIELFRHKPTFLHITKSN